MYPLKNSKKIKILRECIEKLANELSSAKKICVVLAEFSAKVVI